MERGTDAYCTYSLSTVSMGALFWLRLLLLLPVRVVSSSLKMSKMAILIKQQKPGKNRAKNSNAELFIQANDTSLAQGKRILGEIKAILQKTIVLQDVGGTKQKVADDPLKTIPVGSPREATKTHTKPGSARNSAREGKKSCTFAGTG